MSVKARRPHGKMRRLFAHLVRWQRFYGGTYVVEHPRNPGKPIGDIGNAIETSCKAAHVIWITPHTLQHTAITLAIQSGMYSEDAAGYFSTSAETVQETYWHHSPHHQFRAIATMEKVGRAPAQIRPGAAQNGRN